MADIPIGINGFGRIGRLVFRAATAAGGIDIKAINDLTDAATLAHLLKHDSTHGIFDADVVADGDAIVVNGKRIQALAERDPAALPWKDAGVDVVVESTGLFTQKEKAEAHLQAGAGKVLISAPAKGDLATIVLGVNDETMKDSDTIVSNASCTTNCLAPAAAPVVVGIMLPDLNGKLDGLSIRVPTPDGSITDFTVELAKDATKQQVNAAFKKAADQDLKGILEYSEAPLVLTDIIGNPASCILDADSTNVVGGNMVKVLGWYDNEWGYANRCVDLIPRLAG